MVSTALLALAVLATGAGGLAAGLGLAGVAGFAGHLAWQLRKLDIDDPALCLRLFRANRDTGLIAALAFGAAALIAA